MHRIKTASLSALIAVVALGGSNAMAATLSEQADSLLPLSEESLAALGGPSTASELIAGLDGHWFGSENLIRNWEHGKPERLAESAERLCADDWENRVMLVTSGDSTFEVNQTQPDGTDNGSFTLTAEQGREFRISFDEARLLQAYGLDDAPQDEREKALAEFRAIAAQPLRMWRPFPDIAVMESMFGIEVYFRCPQ